MASKTYERQVTKAKRNLKKRGLLDAGAWEKEMDAIAKRHAEAIAKRNQGIASYDEHEALTLGAKPKAKP
jgi:hypothetical protein